ncbi:MAG: hypothetical protein WCS27_11955 [Victivallaceae bacterium]|jgi:hypothetical protein
MNANNAVSRKTTEQHSNGICLMARKPCDLKNLKKQIDRKITLAETGKLTGKHPIFTATFKCWEDYDAADFSANQWWKVMLEKEHIELLVNTEGYSFPRYAGILQNV